MTIIDNLVWIMQGESSQLRRDLKDADRRVNDFQKTAKKADNQLKDMDRSMAKTATSTAHLAADVGNLVGTLLRLASVGMIKGIVTQQADLAIEMEKTGEIIGNSTDAIDRFARGINSAGEDISAGLNMLKAFNERIHQNEELLHQNGVATRTMNGQMRDTLSIYSDLISAASQLSAAERARYFNKFGINPDLAVAMGDTGLFGADFLGQASERRKILDNLSRLQTEIRNKLADMFMPLLISGEKTLKRLADLITNDGGRILRAGLSAIGLLLLPIIARFIKLGAILSIPAAALMILADAIGKVWGELEDKKYRDQWLAEMEKALPNLRDTIKTLKQAWDDFLVSMGKTDTWDFIAGLIGKTLREIERFIGLFRKLKYDLGFGGEKMIDVSGPDDSMAFFKPESEVTREDLIHKSGAQTIPDRFRTPVLPDVIADRNQGMTNISAILPSHKPSVNIHTTQNIDVRPTFNVSGDFDKKVAERTVNQMREVFREEMNKQTRDLATQSATGQER